ncbi:MAG: hypothetical protein LKI24_04090 [Acidipropionibacterium sp.]|jgi:hypothetical protein|nr:hypothetical protein [Acidipropionibacterium sp.]
MSDDKQPSREILHALSAARVSTYLRATGGDLDRAITLYGWNAKVSAAFMVPAHFAEITVRNAVDETLSLVYGPDWPWDSTFERSLPAGRRPDYSPRRDLQAVRSRQGSTGKVIAELRFVFWEKMFTSRHDGRLWIPHIAGQFPEVPRMAPAELRNTIRQNLGIIRALRNRIAHHEPIFARNLAAELAVMESLIRYRSPQTAILEHHLQGAAQLLAERPATTGS